MIARALVVLIVLLAGVGPPATAPLRAQDGPLTATAKQELARTKFRELTERMQKLMAVLQQSEPEDSQLMAAGLQYTQEKKLHSRLERAGSMLQQERWDEALVAMNELKRDLGTLLDLLQDRDADLLRLLEQIKRLEGFKDRVEQLKQEQGEEKEASARTEALQQHLADLEAKKLQAAALLAKQQQLRTQTNELGVAAASAATKPLAEQEGRLQQETAELGKSLEATERKAAELQAAPPSGKPPAEPGGQAARSEGSSSAKQASQAMGQAQQQLGAQKPEASLKDQDQAIQDLQRTIDELERMAEDARRELLKLPFEQQVQRQEQTQAATDALAKDMEASEQQGDGGEPQATPGKQRVQQAVPKQRAAAGQLKEYVPAKQKQQDAKEDLEAAQKELEDALAQLRQQLQDEVLRALEERFTAMLARQRELSAQTRTLDGTRANLLTASGTLPAAFVEKLGELAGGENDLALEAADALKLLEEDATTAVFPPLVEQLRDDLQAVARQLQQQHSGEPVQVAQREVEDLLALLIDALRKTIERKESGH